MYYGVFMRERILDLINSKGYNPLTISEIYDELGLSKAEDFRLLAKELNQMEDEYLIAISKKDRYMSLEMAGYYKGEIRINKKGFGFVIQQGDDIFIPKKYINGVFNGDIVLVKKLDGSRGDSVEGKVVRIIQKSSNVLVGLYQENRETGYVILDDVKLGIAVEVPRGKKGRAVNGSKVIVTLGKKLSDNKYLGNIEKVIGHKNDPGIDILSAIYKHGIDIEFSKQTMEFIESIGEEITSEDLKGRKDLRDEVIVTIDGEDAKDLDDAISIRRMDNGNYHLGVHIADVSYYVTEKSPLDDDAKRRSTSVYLVDRVIPMLPHYLSNNICSLNPHVDRLTMSCEMEIDNRGKVVSYDIFPSVINSSARMTYTDVNLIIEGDNEKRSEYSKLVDTFLLMNELAHIIRKSRSRRGSLDFDVPESKIVVDEKSRVVDIVIRERFDAERLIEDFMILANETVASHFFYQDLPFVYRIHTTPKEERMEEFLHVARVMGHKIQTNNNVVSNHTVKKIIDDLEGEQSYILKTLLLRSMQKAVYDVNNVGHYGLASKCYTHFTSPIRRYPDLMVHRLIRKYLVKNDYNYNDRFIENLAEQTAHSSRKERAAMECEFDVKDMKKAEYMAKFIGEEFEGTISSLTNFGMFVELPNTVEGLIRYVDLTDDHYIYDDKRLLVHGKRSNKVFKLGDKVKVIVAKATKETGEIDFALSR